jgi:hypothetical protein
METFPGVSAAPVSVTSAESMLTFEGGVSVTARTIDELPDGVCPPNCVVPPQPANAAQMLNTEIIKIE